MSTKADQIAAQVTRGQWDHYMQQFAPLEEQLVGDINSNKLVEGAQKQAEIQNTIANASLGRTQERYGVNMLGAQKDRMERLQALGQATGAAQAVNTARIDQRERNMSLAASLMQQGRGVAAQGIKGLGDVAGMEAQRNAANAQAKAQQRASTMSTIGSLGALALIAW